MNILQLLTSLNDEISIRAIAAYSRILKDNGCNSYVFAPLGRELSYFKRWGAEIACQSATSADIVYYKSIIKEICDLVSSKSISTIHVYDMAGYKAALQVSKNCRIKIIFSLLKTTSEETVIGILVSNVNSSSADVTIDLSVTKSGGSLRHILNNVSLPFGTTIEITTKVCIVIGTG